MEEHNSEDITLSYTCGKCDQKFQRITDLNMHIDDRHKPKETATLQVGDINMIQNKNDHTATSSPELVHEISICGECSQQFSVHEECIKHIESHSFKCDKCDYLSKSEEEVKAHEAEHVVTRNQLSKESFQVKSFKCEKCDQTFESVDVAKKHKCGHVGDDHVDLAKHSAENPGDETLTSTMFDQVREGLEHMEVMRKMLLQLIQGQNEMKQELFVIRNKQETVPIQQDLVETPNKRTYAEAASTPTVCSLPNTSPRVPQPHSMTHQIPPQKHSSPEPPQNPPRQVERSQILFVGDSISGNINIQAIEKAIGKEFVCKKAYTAVHDTKRNVAKGCRQKKQTVYLKTLSK